MTRGGDKPKPRDWKAPPPWNRGRPGAIVHHEFKCRDCPRVYTYKPDACKQCGSSRFRRIEA